MTSKMIRFKTLLISNKVPLSILIHKRRRTATAIKEEIIYKLELNKKEETG